METGRYRSSAWKLTVNATGGFGSALADASLAPAGNGSTLHFAGEVKIPLLGGQLEKSYAAGMAKNIAELQRFTATWIAEHA